MSRSGHSRTSARRKTLHGLAGIRQSGYFFIYQAVGATVNPSRWLSALSSGGGTQSDASRLMETANETVQFEFASERQSERINEDESWLQQSAKSEMSQSVSLL